ncbi:enoyl-CoA hydratase/isomerase family protein [Bosea rubneri]|uniref:Enoyl-CoA hydratase/isomerase family protein n=1 Tax=Bosea rubneri TaxID=3075434 RepID=A0ABU3S6W9_9HYPH|nr:enoyl-CoA hydratase/isomerase family protein [Bosea sp. ZW T0_25]MDU0340532.1 enoyl-CoA hydratase/isomerase family protein [Bosea sp. ZW T0_25]
MTGPSEGIRAQAVDGGFAVTIDRAERGNMLTLPMIAALAQAVRDTPREAKFVHLSGAGADFCRGRDPQGAPAAATALEIRAALIEPILSLYDALSHCPVPVVCSVRGAARGLGAALATACDVTIAAESARFDLPEMERDLPPTLAISAMMRKVSPKALALMVYGMEPVEAREAQMLGLVSKVVSDDALTPETERLLGTLRARSREALVAVKDYQRAAPELGARSGRDLAANLLASVLSSKAR